MTENSPEPRGIRKAKKATWKCSPESNSDISPLLLLHNSLRNWNVADTWFFSSITFCILKSSFSPLELICQNTIKLIMVYIPGVSAVCRKTTRWQYGFRFLYFKGMIYRQKTLTGSLNYFPVFHFFLVWTSLVIKWTCQLWFVCWNIYN